MYTPTNEIKEPSTPMKYVIVTGGVVSGLGKGITASSIGLLLKQSGLKVTSIKIDPYLNQDAGTMSPYEHGEVFVLDDGAEADLDLGNYERFLSVSLTANHNITNGKVWQKVLNTERKGGYLGKTVQMVPHVTNCIQEWIEKVSQVPVDGSNECPDVCVIELGGTVGDLESVLFLEAIRQFKFRFGDHIFHLHVSLIPVLGNVGELKSKPTQHSVRELRTTGLIPDCIVLRCKQKIPQKIINKVSIFSMVPPQNIVGVHDVDNIYQVPQLLLDNRMMQIIFQNLKFEKLNKIDLTEWNKIGDHFKDELFNEDDNESKVNNMENNKNTSKKGPKKSITIGIVGKYTGLSDAYLSVTKALISAAYHSNVDIKLIWIESEHLEGPKKKKKEAMTTPKKKSPIKLKESVSPTQSTDSLQSGTLSVPDDTKSQGYSSASDSEMVVIPKKDIVHNVDILESPNTMKDKKPSKLYRSAWNKVKSVDGILVPGGFGDRGIEGKILAANYARTNNIPFLGICLGLQMAVIEYSRNILGLKDAQSSEFDKNTKNPVVMFMPEIDEHNLGGTMRLGSRKCNLKEKSLAHYLYGQKGIYERHRHRYEVNPDYVKKLTDAGLLFTGKDETNTRMEIVELPPSKHPFYFACQFHPEFKSGPLRPSPPFFGFVRASSGSLFEEKEFQKQFGSKKNIQKAHSPQKKLKFTHKSRHSNEYNAKELID